MIKPLEVSNGRGSKGEGEGGKGEGEGGKGEGKERVGGRVRGKRWDMWRAGVVEGGS